MALILNIDTAGEAASICLSKDGNVLQLSVNENQKDHAARLQVAIQKLIRDAGYEMRNIDAIAVTIGPGSYTGLRVGLSSAKGLCYVLKTPLIAINTLKMMASAVKNEDAEFFCPMIDARRMEVFAAVYNRSLEEIMAPHALIINKNSFEDILQDHSILFFGNGSDKLKRLLMHHHAVFKNIKYNASHLSILAENCFRNGQFSDLAYAEPFYLKEFFTPGRKSGQ